jgi:CrcB protein
MPATLFLYLAVAAGGAVGATARYLAGTLVAQLAPPGAFPWSTFAVNVCGCLVFGVLAGTFERAEPGLTVRTFLLAGVLGGFTTFSAFAAENVALLGAGQIGHLAINVAGQVLLGVAGLWLGLLLARALAA